MLYSFIPIYVIIHSFFLNMFSALIVVENFFIYCNSLKQFIAMHSNFILTHHAFYTVRCNEVEFSYSIFSYSPKYYDISYADFNSSLNLSAIIAINSEFVGFPFAAEIVYPKIFSTISCCPLPHATSMA